MQRILMMSGFLGAGKTTSMIALARCLQDAGTSVALITNDLGENLVDTAYVGSFDMPVLEIPNTCCCQDVDTLNSTISRHVEAHHPDIVVFEPVGCCVDMVKLVYENLQDAYPGTYELAPISAIIDPTRYEAIYMGKGENTFPEYIDYMFRKQLEEADLLIVNKCDLLDDSRLNAISEHLHATFPDKRVLSISALERRGIEEWAHVALTGETAMARTGVDMAYVMNACEKLGWYNKVCQVSSDGSCDYAAFNDWFVRQVKEDFKARNAEIAHLKIAASHGQDVCKTALTSILEDPRTVGSCTCSGEAVLNVNIRALMGADELNAIMEDALAGAIAQFRLRATRGLSQTFLSSNCAPEPAEEYIPGTEGAQCCVPGYNDGSSQCCCC